MVLLQIVFHYQIFHKDKTVKCFCGYKSINGICIEEDCNFISNSKVDFTTNSISNSNPNSSSNSNPNSNSNSNSNRIYNSNSISNSNPNSKSNLNFNLISKSNSNSNPILNLRSRRVCDKCKVKHITNFDLKNPYKRNVIQLKLNVKIVILLLVLVS